MPALRKTVVGGEPDSAAHHNDDPEQRRKNVDADETRSFGTWIGEHWIPDPSNPEANRHYSAKEIHRVFATRKTLFFGDSTGRRAYATLFEILKQLFEFGGGGYFIPQNDIESDEILNVNKGATDISNRTEVCLRDVWEVDHSSLCRYVPRSFIPRAYFDYAGHHMCYNHILKLTSNMTWYEEYDLIVVSMGPWETGTYGARKFCMGENEKSNNFPDSMYKRMERAIDALAKIATSERQIIWRTSGYNTKKQFYKEALEMNRRAIVRIEAIRKRKWEEEGVRSNLTYVDWGGFIHGRSFYWTRIKGDGANHYGFEARLAFAQLLVGHLEYHRKMDASTMATVAFAG